MTKQDIERTLIACMDGEVTPIDFTHILNKYIEACSDDIYDHHTCFDETDWAG